MCTDSGYTDKPKKLRLLFVVHVFLCDVCNNFSSLLLLFLQNSLQSVVSQMVTVIDENLVHVNQIIVFFCVIIVCLNLYNSQNGFKFLSDQCTCRTENCTRDRYWCSQ